MNEKPNSQIKEPTKKGIFILILLKLLINQQRK